MTFVAPLLLAGLGLLVPIVVAFMVRRRRRVLRVPSTLLWRRAALTRARSHRIRVLTRLLALLACLIGVTSLVVAAARPALPARGEALAIVVDVSASMQAGALARARGQVQRLLAGRGASDPCLLIAAGPFPRRLAGPTTDDAALDEGARHLHVEAGPADLGAALSLASSLLAAAPRARIVLVDDGGASVGDLTFERRGITVEELRVAPDVSDNLGIAAFATRPPHDRARDDEREAMIAIATSSRRARRALVTLEAEGRVIAERLIEVSATGEAETAGGAETAGEAEVRVRVHFAAGRLTARVSPADDLADAVALDDTAHLDEGPHLPPRALLLATPSEAGSASAFFAEQALRAAGVHELVRVAASEVDHLARPGDVVVALGQGPARRPAVPILYIATTHGALPSPVRELATDRLGLQSVASADPIVRGVELDGVTMERAVALETPATGRALVDLDGGTVVAAGGVGRTAWVFLGIDVSRSDLVLRVAFPVLVANALAELGGASTVSNARTVPRAEIAMRRADFPGVTRVPEPPWQLPIGTPALLALLGITCLALEAWAGCRTPPDGVWRRGSVS